MQGTFNTSDFDRINTENEDNTHPYGEDSNGDEEEIIYGDDTDTTTDEEADEYSSEAEMLQDDVWQKLKQQTVEESAKNNLPVKVLAKPVNAQKGKYNAVLARKDALVKAMAPRAEGICPVCHKRSIFKSYRPMDLALFTGLVALVTAGSSRISTFYCMNRKCRVSYWKNFCFRCAGDRWVGGKVPWKRIAGVDM